LNFKEKQLWEYRIILHSSSIHVIFFFACPSSFAASCTHAYGSHEHLPAYRTVKNNGVLMRFF